MRAVVWIVEDSWEVCVDHAGELLPADAELALLHVAAGEIEELAEHPGPGRLGRRHHPPPPRPGRAVREISDAEAQALLEAARQRLGRPAELLVRCGRVEREVVAACAGLRAEVLVLARDGDLRPGPHSLGRHARFVVDHAPCAVVLVWAEPPALPR